MPNMLTIPNAEKRWTLAICAAAGAYCAHTHQLVLAARSRFRIIPPPEDGLGRLVFVFRRARLGRRVPTVSSHLTSAGADIHAEPKWVRSTVLTGGTVVPRKRAR